jgi:hypothetical protein
MGFHAGSEVLADREFTVLDRVLRERLPALVAHLEQTRVPILGERHDAYYWVRIHTGVEAEHFEYALRGVRKALRFYAGTQPRGLVKEWVLGGFSWFAVVQSEFLAALAGD